MIKNRVVYGETATGIPTHLSFGKYVIDQLRGMDDDVALINGETDESITRKQLLQKLANVATGLKRLGVKKGDVVGICSENRIEYMISALGVICVGAVLTPVNILYTHSELNHVMNISKPKFMFCSERALNHNFNNFDFVKAIILFDKVQNPDSNLVLYKAMVAKNVDVSCFEAEEVQGYIDTVLIMYSSGTTGLPKGVMLTHVNLLFYAINGRSEGPKIKRFLTVAPWYHGYGLMSTLTYTAFGSTMVFLQSFKPKLYLNAIQKYKIQSLLTVPLIVVFLTKSPIVDEYDVSSVELIFCAAAPLSPDIIEYTKARFPNCRALLQSYGMTETALSITIDAEHINKHKAGSCGVPLPGLELKVVHLETQQPLDMYQEGEICVKGPNVMKGYLGNEAATSDIIDKEGFLRTGDIGYYDNEGFFYIVDRLKELIKYKGHQVPPAEVESALLQHGGVAECGVVGKPDLKTGELATAFVVKKRGALVTERELLDFTATKLSPAKRLYGGVLFVDEIPKNPSGKILRRVLKERLKQKLTSKL